METWQSITYVGTWKEPVAKAQEQEILKRDAGEVFGDWTGKELERHAKESELPSGIKGKSI